jgi:cytochrome c2
MRLTDRARHLLFGSALAIFGCSSQSSTSARRGRVLIGRSGCGTCHVIPGVAGARGQVGPTLSQFGRRDYIAGVLLNTPDNLVRWLISPQSVKPGDAMPDLGITRGNAADIAAYLYSLR